MSSSTEFDNSSTTYSASTLWCEPDAKRFSASFKLWTMVVLIVPAILGLVVLLLASAVTWLSVFVYWRQLRAVEKLAKQMMDLAMSLALPDIVHEKATAMYGATKTGSKITAMSMLSAKSKGVSAQLSALTPSMASTKVPVASAKDPAATAIPSPPTAKVPSPTSRVPLPSTKLTTSAKKTDLKKN